MIKGSVGVLGALDGTGDPVGDLDGDLGDLYGVASRAGERDEEGDEVVENEREWGCVLGKRDNAVVTGA